MTERVGYPETQLRRQLDRQRPSETMTGESTPPQRKWGEAAHGTRNVRRGTRRKRRDESAYQSV